MPQLRWRSGQNGHRESFSHPRQYACCRCRTLGYAILLAALSALFHANLACEYNFPNRSETRMAVCVVGQVSRTEVPSKVKNLLKANAGLGALDVFLVMEEGEARYTNMHMERCKASPSSLSVLERTFSAHARVVTVPRSYESFEDVIDPSAWVSYGGLYARRLQRVGNHLNQYTSWHQCMEAIEAQEEMDQQKYHAVLRIRDNTLVLAKYDLYGAFILSGAKSSHVSRHSMAVATGILTNSLSKGKCIREPKAVTKNCATWGGYPDKVMLTPRSYANDVMSGPLLDHKQMQIDNRELKLLGTEMYLKEVLDRRNVPVALWTANFMPLTDGRCETGRSFCVTQSRKDCKPSKLSVPWPTCELTYLSSNIAKEKDRINELMEKSQNASSTPQPPVNATSAEPILDSRPSSSQG